MTRSSPKILFRRVDFPTFGFPTMATLVCVPADVWEGFVQATSKGNYIQQVLNHYDHGPAEI